LKAAIIEKLGDIRVGTVDDPTPGRGEIVVKVGACGICGTDLHIADGECAELVVGEQAVACARYAVDTRD